MKIETPRMPDQAVMEHVAQFIRDLHDHGADPGAIIQEMALGAVKVLFAVASTTGMPPSKQDEGLEVLFGDMRAALAELQVHLGSARTH